MEKFYPLILTTCHNQQTDSKFYQILEKLRMGILDPQTKSAIIQKIQQYNLIKIHYTQHI
jgi:hypothetical protein